MKKATKIDGFPIIERNGRYYLRKTFDGNRGEFPLGDNLKNAKTKCNRFLATFSTSGLDTAVLELTGKKVIKAGCNPTIQEMETLYRDFCKQSAKTPREITIKRNVFCLKLIMTRSGVDTVGKIDQTTIFKKWFQDIPNPSTSQRRTFSSTIKAASSIFKIAALSYYKARNIPLENPFKGMELITPVIQAYVPIPAELRESIWNDCRKSEEIHPWNGMVVLLALGAGMRRGEIECMKKSWISVQTEGVTITIEEEGEFKPKVNDTGLVTIPTKLYETLLKLRGDDDSDFFIPAPLSTLKGRGRIQDRFREINDWLKKKGLKNQKAIQDLRKEYGSHIAKTQSILAASKALRNTVAVCGIHYSGIAEIELVDIQESFQGKKDPFQALADQLGITVEDLKKKLSA